MSRAREFSGTPHQRIERMIALALSTCGVPRERLAMVEPDAAVLQVRRLAAWLMRQRAGIAPADAAAALGVSPGFVGLTVFSARQRLAAQGLRIDGPVEAVAATVARIFAPRDDEPDPVAVASLAEIREAVLAAFQLTPGVITGDQRGSRAVRARQAFAWLAAMLTPAAPKEIGSWINRERTTVEHAISKIDLSPGIGELRRQVLAALASGPPTQTALIAFATALARLPSPSPQRR